MTTKKHKELAQQHVARFKKNFDIDFTELTDDVVWVVGGSSPDIFVGKYVGPEAVKKLLALHHQTVEVEMYEIDEYIAEDDKVVLVGRERIKFKDSGRVLGGPLIYRFIMRDGKIANVLALRDDTFA